MASVLNYDVTVERIMKGDIPEITNRTTDIIIHVPDGVGVTYSNIMARLLLQTVNDTTPEEIIGERVEIYDRLMNVVSQCRFGRLFNMIEGLNSVVGPYLTRSDVFSSNRVRNNVLSFAVDWWMMDAEQRNKVLVIDEVDDVDKAATYVEDDSQVPVEASQKQVLEDVEDDSQVPVEAESDGDHPVTAYCVVE